MPDHGQFPATRLRRLRRDPFSRALSREHRLAPGHLILPAFVVEGEGVQEPVTSMPGVSRWSIDGVVALGRQCVDLGVPAMALFPVIDPLHKTLQAERAWDPDDLVPRTLQALRAACPDLGLITDIALDPYTSHGQDGLLDETGYVVNDATVEALCRQAINHARAGADVVAPSDMMDGRVGAIRRALDAEGLQHVRILSYAAKYASAFYGPFRDAVGSKAALGSADKRTYQMDPANVREALREVALDVAEGADMVMVKPAMPYLDVVKAVRDAFDLPVAAYQVSGEYAMLHAAAAQGWLDLQRCMMESLLGIHRAGATAILTYFALDAARWLRDHAGDLG
jgi:porphobilinogen synthase